MCVDESTALKERLARLKKEKDAVILAHSYQRAEGQDATDYVGDSFELSKMTFEIRGPVIVFCDVDFIAENAAIRSPEKVCDFLV